MNAEGIIDLRGAMIAKGVIDTRGAINAEGDIDSKGAINAGDALFCKKRTCKLPPAVIY